MTENPYSAPRSEVVDAPRAEGSRPTAGARFLWTAGIGFPVYMFFVFFAPKEIWLIGALGSGLFACLSGLIAMCIPARNKAAFIIPSILVGVTIAYLIGASTT